MLTGWSYYKTITVPAAYITGSEVNFPLTVVLDGDTDVGVHAKSNGYDLRFTLADDTLLDYERESFSVTGGAADGLFHVCLPSITSGVDCVIYLQYGNSGASDGADATGATWDEYYAGVWHFGDGSTLDLSDATANGNDGTNNGATAAAGKVGGAASFDGGDYVIAGTDLSAAIASSGMFTIAVWVKTASGAGVESGLAGIGDKIYNGWSVYVDGADSGKPSAVASGTYGQRIVAASAISDNAWHHVVGNYDGTGVRIYLDGLASDPRNVTLADEAGKQCYIGASSATEDKLIGLLDELRISSTARSAAWISLEYNCVANQASAVTWGEETTWDVIPTKPSLWLDASGLSAGALATWADLSGEGNDATQATEANQPTVVAGELNGLPVVRCASASGQFLQSLVDVSAGEWTVCVLARTNGLGADARARVVSSEARYYNWLVGWCNGAEDQAYYDGVVKLDYSPAASTDWKLYTGLGNATTGKLFSNGSLIASDTPHQGPREIILGGWTSYGALSQNSDCDIAEILVFPSALSDTDRQAVEAYLNAKWFVSTPAAGNTVNSFDYGWSAGPWPSPWLMMSETTAISERIHTLAGIGGAGVYGIPGIMYQYANATIEVAPKFRRTSFSRTGSRGVQ